MHRIVGQHTFILKIRNMYQFAIKDKPVKFSRGIRRGNFGSEIHTLNMNSIVSANNTNWFVFF
jgi:hypothetical protein